MANIALHGLSVYVRDAFQTTKYLNGRDESPTMWKPVVIRYADYFVILHPDLDALKQAEQIAAEWLKGMGLEMKPNKTRITHTLWEVGGNVGFDSLGFNFRQYPRGKNRCMKNTNGEPVGFTTSVRPSSKSQKQFLRKVRDIVRRNQNSYQPKLIWLLNPIIRGWGNYFSSVVSKEIFGKMDTLIYQKLWAWAKRRHSNKKHRWVAHKYWLFGGQGWRFGKKGVAVLHQLSDIPIRRHIVVQKHRSPYDGNAIYWSARMGRHPGMPWSFAWLLKAQLGRCPHCGLFFKHGDQMIAQHPRGWTTGRIGKAVLIHEHCKAITYK